MILRRLAAAFRRQDWFTVFVETMIVVLGVFLGLQVQQWSNQRADKSREMQIVADMLADLEIDRTQYGNAMALGAQRVAAARISLEKAGLPSISFDYDLPNSDIVDYDTDILDLAGQAELETKNLWTSVVVGYFPTPSTSTYDAIVGSGEISIIRDRSLVKAIQVYRNLTESVASQNDKLISIRADAMRVGARHGLAPYLPVRPDDYFQLVSGDPELAATIRILATFSIFHFGDIESADRRAQALQSQLEDYLEAAK
ncbi:MAG: hypothetical protein GC152_12545 [Alphaproteobacteria bacterium]|nr:hypothetical protein [Alphaproteobacteria bacterium]